jgi:hypothetical protein
MAFLGMAVALERHPAWHGNPPILAFRVLYCPAMLRYAAFSGAAL